jgi:hypothetical protein
VGTARAFCVLTLDQLSFVQKLSFQDIKFDDQAWDHVVLEQSTKEIVRSLVEASKKENTDNKSLLTDVVRAVSALSCVADKKADLWKRRKLRDRSSWPTWHWQGERVTSE